MRQFTFRNNQWTVELSGISSGVSSGKPSNIMTSFSVIFKYLSDSEQKSHHGIIRHKNIDDETDDNLRKSLEKAMDGN
jgi:hypothetical protein